jgi:predicted DNA-binding transcriptional regulator
MESPNPLTQIDASTPASSKNSVSQSQSQGPGIKSTSLLIIGTLVALFSGCCAAEVIVEMLGASVQFSGFVAALVFFVGLIVASAAVVRAQLKERKAVKDLNQEQRILNYAKAENGRGLTVSEISLTCALTIRDTVDVINSLVTRGVCQTDVSEKGELLYAFPCFSKQKEVQEKIVLEPQSQRPQYVNTIDFNNGGNENSVPVPPEIVK